MEASATTFFSCSLRSSATDRGRSLCFPQLKSSSKHLFSPSGRVSFSRPRNVLAVSADHHEPDGAKPMFTTIPGSDLPYHVKTSSKITVVGVGNVGMACAQTCVTEGLVDELALVDIQADKLRGEMLDLQHAAAFLPRVNIMADSDYAVSEGSDICIVTAGARQREGESRLSLLGRNLSLFKSIIPQLVRYSPDTILLIVSNPVDILTYLSWKISGFPPNRVIGTGTNLDSSRLRFLIADKFDVNAHNVHGYMVGEHGDSSVPLWSTLTIANMPVLSICDKDGVKYSRESLQELHKMVVGGAYEVIKLKGYTSWAIGYSTASLVKSLLRDQRRIHPVSVLAKGFYGIDKDVYLSLPSQLGRAGVLGVASVQMIEEERRKLHESSETIWDIQNQLQI
ncbi:hypothetical protein KP509_18G010800 [Ceratopteris richardii]|uniref:L-lactate dehydrogenase n=3 Tax=Ceratopteris richardii TaxID=49495 RepID=A0A8T2SR58_CERRI|nr:hypothetical protein KP509_18G010800 [Ceratopteris richardii]